MVSAREGHFVCQALVRQETAGRTQTAPEERYAKATTALPAKPSKSVGVVWCATREFVKQATVSPQRTVLAVKFAKAIAAQVALHPQSVGVAKFVTQEFAKQVIV